MISDSQNIEIDNILLRARERMEDRTQASRAGFRRKKFWKKRYRRPSKATTLSRTLGTKVFYTKLDRTFPLDVDSFGILKQVYGLRDVISGHDDWSNFKTIFQRVQVPSIAITIRRKENPGSTVTNAIGAYDSTVSTTLTSLGSAESFAKKMYFNPSGDAPMKYAFKLEQAAFSIQPTETFSTDTNILGWFKFYSSVMTPNITIGYITFSCNLYLMDRK